MKNNTNTSFIKKLCDFDKTELLIKTELLRISGEVIKKEYVIRNKNKSKITDFLKYFTGNSNELDSGNGIYIFGTYGCGKTVLFQVIKKILASLFPFSGNSYQITSLVKIIEKFKADNTLDYFGHREDSESIHL